MTPLIVSVEGQSEEIFVNLLLVPHLAAFGVYASASIVGKTIAQARGHTSRGGGMFRNWAEDLRRICASDASAELRLTTLFDLYGLPDDFPGADIHDPNTLALRATRRRARSSRPRSPLHPLYTTP